MRLYGAGGSHAVIECLTNRWLSYAPAREVPGGVRVRDPRRNDRSASRPGVYSGFDSDRQVRDGAGSLAC